MKNIVKGTLDFDSSDPSGVLRTPGCLETGAWQRMIYEYYSLYCLLCFSYLSFNWLFLPRDLGFFLFNVFFFYWVQFIDIIATHYSKEIFN